METRLESLALLLDRAMLESATYISDVNADTESRSRRHPEDEGLSSIEVLERRLPS